MVLLSLALLTSASPALADTVLPPGTSTAGRAVQRSVIATTSGGSDAATRTGRDALAEADPGPAAGAGSVTSDGSAPDPAGAPAWGTLGLEQALRAVFAATAFSAIGVFVFVRTVSDGSDREFVLLCRVIERGSFVAAVVVVLQFVVRAARTAGDWSATVHALPEVLAASYGSGLALRAAGAVLLVVGASTLRRTRTSTLPATLGAALVVGSFALAGYSASAQPRLVSAFAIVAHVAAAAAWGGGLLALVITLRHRSRARRPLRAGYVAARFSVVATCGVALAVIAGVALAVVRLDSIDALWTTAYGLTLVAKVTLVALVAGIGTYNHFVVVPILRVAPDHAMGRRLRWLGSVEVALFALVVGVNSVLVGLGR